MPSIDIRAIMYACGFTSTSYAASNSNAAAIITVVATAPTETNQLTTTRIPSHVTASNSGSREINVVSQTTLTTATATATSTRFGNNNDDDTDDEYTDDEDNSSSRRNSSATTSATGNGNSAVSVTESGAMATQSTGAASGLSRFGIAGALVAGAAAWLA